MEGWDDPLVESNELTEQTPTVTTQGATCNCYGDDIPHTHPATANAPEDVRLDVEALAKAAHDDYRLKHPEMMIVPWADTSEGSRQVSRERVESVLALLRRVSGKGAQRFSQKWSQDAFVILAGLKEAVVWELAPAIMKEINRLVEELLATTQGTPEGAK